MRATADRDVRRPARQRLRVSLERERRDAASWDVVLRNLDHEELQVDSPHGLEPGDTISIEGDLEGAGYSLHLIAQARVLYSRRVALDERGYYIGAKVLEVGYRPVAR